MSATREHFDQKRWELALLKRRVTLLPGCKATSLHRISFGSDVLISHGSFLQGAGGIRIGDMVMMGPQVMLVTTGHDKISGESQSAPIEIGDGAWIGARAIVLPGVSVGAGSVVAAGALVSKDVAPFTVVGGVPAKEIGKIDPEGATKSYFKSQAWLGQF